jgi:hypothetical protein
VKARGRAEERRGERGRTENGAERKEESESESDGESESQSQSQSDGVTQ